MTQQMQIRLIREAIEELAGNEYLYFDAPLFAGTVRHPLELWGATVDPAGDILLMDRFDKWRHLGDNPDESLLRLLLKRLQAMQKQYCTTENS